MTVAPFLPIIDLESRICAAQSGDELATEALLEQFRPLLRSRMHYLWGAVRESFSTLEFADIEAQITFLFLSRLHSFRADAGVYFPYYIEKMLDLDLRSWLRQQRRSNAIPFSQLTNIDSNDENAEPSEWLFEGVGAQESAEVERNLALNAALETLSLPQREVVWRCCVLGRTEMAAARELGLPRSTVRNRLEAAILKMREFFEEAEGTTRTGRASKKPRLSDPREEFWEFINTMVKDEKRPDLVGVGAGRPILLQGTFDFPVTGIKTPELLSKKLVYTVPIGHVLGIRYLRVGNVSDGMVVVSTIVNGLPHRIVPCAANDAIHVPFAIVDPILPGSQIEIYIASSHAGTAIIDCGCLQMPA
ncbi:sigma-70 family RNA polymerase sigma factor [bacterium]|nr:MAG: sigma-70 family RNA polymerase sigma factor [bacterium]